MIEVLSDERFLELFGNEPYPDFAPDVTDYCARSCKFSYVGKRPLEFKYRDFQSVCSNNEDMDPRDFYGAIPALLLGMLRKPDDEFLDGYGLGGFRWFFNVGGESYEFYPGLFKEIGYKSDQIQYMILMLTKLKKIVTVDEEDGFLSPFEIIDACINDLNSVL